MGVKVFTIEARAAAALSAAGKSLWIPCRGAKMVAFKAAATDAGSLSAFGAEVFHGTGTPPTGAQTGWTVGGGPATVTNAFITGNAFNSAILGPLRAFVTPSSPLPFFGCDFVRATYTPTTTIAGFALVAEVYYDDEDMPAAAGGAALVGIGNAT